MSRARLVRVAGRALRWFWLGVFAIAIGGGALLTYLGPPRPDDASTATKAPDITAVDTKAPDGRTANGKSPESTSRQAAAEMPAPAGAPASPQTHDAAAAAAGDRRAAPQAGRAEPPGTIAPVDTTLEEPSADYLGASLPRPALDGRTPMQVYARGFDPADKRPRIGLLMSGFGLNPSVSADALKTLPGAVTIAVSPYAVRPEPLLEQARAAGHEFLISLPMEPQGYPLNSEGPHMMLTESRVEDNLLQLQWALSRIGGYVGATGALDGLRGERFPQITDQFADVMDRLATRGLLYIDPRAGQPNPPRVVGRAIDLVIDDLPTREAIAAKLAALEQIARQKGSALGLAGPPRPATVEAVTGWANGLAAKDLALAPVSALVAAPSDAPVTRK